MSRFEVHYEHFKREDTTNSMVVNLYNDDGTAITPNSGHTWVGKIAKDDKYVGEYPLTISGTKIMLPSSSLTRLPFGEYQLELWETTGGQTTIYPNAGFIPVTIHRNADDTMGEVDPTTDINKIIADLKTAGTNLKVGSTTTLAAGSQAAVSQTIANGQNTINFAIPRGAQGIQGPQGPKGNTGDVGPQGPQGDTNETATNALNVANSVNDKLSVIQANGGGRNLARNTSSDWTDLTGFDNKVNYSFYTANIYLDTLQVGDTMTWGITLKNTGITSGSFILQGSGNVTNWNDGTTLTGVSSNFASELPAGTTKTFVLRTVITKGQKQNDYFNFQLRTNNVPKGGTLSYRCIFAEKGTVAHDWSPALEEILTQSDYAKIKAAIVALGGSLS